MQTLVFILWRIGSLWSAIIRSAKKTVVRIMVQKKAGRQVAPTVRMRSRLPFMKYDPYTACNGI